MEQDKDRLSSQLNQMLKNYKELQTKLELQGQAHRSEEEGLQNTIRELVSQIRELSELNANLKSENGLLKHKAAELASAPKEGPQPPALEAAATGCQECKIRQEREDRFVLKFTSKEKTAIDSYFVKYVDKLYKILKKLNVKVVSYEVLKKDMAA